MKKLYELSGIVLSLVLVMVMVVAGCSKESVSSEEVDSSENPTVTENVGSVEEEGTVEEGYTSKINIKMFGHVLGETKNEEIGSLSSSMRRTEKVQKGEDGLIAYDYTGTKVLPDMQSATRLMFYDDRLISFVLVFNPENEKIDSTTLADVFVEKLRPYGKPMRKEKNFTRIDIIDCDNVGFHIKSTLSYVMLTAMHMDGMALKKTNSEFKIKESEIGD